MGLETIWIGNDHGGYELKVKIVEHLAAKGIDVHDVGSGSDKIVRYPYYAAPVAGAVSRGEAARGILICSTGIGMSILANKFRGVRASVCTSTYLAKMTRAHNDSNILCLGGKTTGLDEALDMITFWCRYIMDKEFADPEGWQLQNTLTVARLIAMSARQRQESRGVHYRVDFPDTSPDWQRHIVVSKGGEEWL